MTQSIPLRNPRLCTTCGKTHNFPVPKFGIGQKVKLISDAGFHHKDKVGCEAVIEGIITLWVDPCDEVEYRTSFGDGAILESRLKAV